MTAGLSPRAHPVIQRATASQASVRPSAKRAGKVTMAKMPPHRKGVHPPVGQAIVDHAGHHEQAGTEDGEERPAGGALNKKGSHARQPAPEQQRLGTGRYLDS